MELQKNLQQGQQSSPKTLERNLDGTMDRRNFLRILSLPFLAGAAEALAEEESPFQGDLKQLRGLLEDATKKDGESLYGEGFSGTLEEAIQMFSDKEALITKEQVDIMIAGYRVIAPYLKSLDVKLKADFAKMPEGQLKETTRLKCTLLSEDIKMIDNVPKMYKGDAETPKKSPMEIIAIMDAICVRQEVKALGKQYRMNNLTPSMKDGSAKIGLLSGTIKKAIKTKSDTDPTFKITPGMDKITSTLAPWFKEEVKKEEIVDFEKKLKGEGFNKVRAVSLVANKTSYKFQNDSITIDKPSGSISGMLIVRANPSGETTWIVELEGIQFKNLSKDPQASLMAITSGSAWDGKVNVITQDEFNRAFSNGKAKFLVRSTAGKQDTLRIMLGGEQSVAPLESGKIGKIKITPFQKK